MARKRSEAEGNHIGAAEAFLSRCFGNEVAMCIQPTFGQEYIIKDKPYIFTHFVLDQMIATGKVTVTNRNDKTVNIRGLLAQ